MTDFTHFLINTLGNHGFYDLVG